MTEPDRHFYMRFIARVMVAIRVIAMVRSRIRVAFRGVILGLGLLSNNIV